MAGALCSPDSNLTRTAPTSAGPTATGCKAYVQLRDCEARPLTHDIWVETPGPPTTRRFVSAGSGTASGKDPPSTVMVN